MLHIIDLSQYVSKLEALMLEFGIKDQRLIKQRHCDLHAAHNMGTVEIDGVAYDWFENGDELRVMEAV